MRRASGAFVRPGSMRNRFVLPALCLALLCGCGTPVGVRRADPQWVHRELERNVISSGELSTATANVLFARDLRGRFDEAPEEAISELHRIVVSGPARRRDIFALAEMSFYRAEREDSRPDYLAAAIYAYAFLFPANAQDTPSGFDPRFRAACDIYNRAITQGLASAETARFEPRSGTFALPFGSLDVSFDPESLRWEDRLLTEFVPVAELDVRGLDSRYRWPGIGAPLAASTVSVNPQGFDDFVLPWVKVVRTAVLRIDDVEEQLRNGSIRARLELVTPGRSENVEINGHVAPLELETSASLAYMLAESPVWRQELSGFLNGMGVIDERSRLAAFTPHHRGRIPVVFVHGTASSSGRWAQMLNELVNDSTLRQRYEFWVFTYNTGNPILYSAMLLRESLRDAVERLGGVATDPALGRMVVVGHSQGGLLTKLTAIESGSKFWDGISPLPFDRLDLSDEARDLVRKAVFLRPLPFVRRLVFMATPQHGSYFAGNWISHVMARFITLPVDLVHLNADLLLRNRRTLAFASLGSMPTAVDNMTPGSQFIRTLGAIPVEPDVHAHSIIAVQGDGPPEKGTDGVVAFASARIEGVDSEYIVRSGHSCQGNPRAIEEVRRILHAHLEESPP